MTNKRSRRTSRKRGGQSTAAASKKRTSISTPMELCDPLIIELDKPDELELAELPSASKALRAALHGTGRIGSFEDSGQRLMCFASAPGLARLSCEELRIAANLAGDACDVALDRRKFPHSISSTPFLPNNATYPKCVTPANAAALFAITSRNSVEGIAEDPGHASFVADTFSCAMRISTLARGDDERNNTYVFHPYSEARTIDDDDLDDTLFNIARRNGLDVSRLDEIAQAVASRIDAYDSLTDGFQTIEPFALPPTPGKEQRRGVVNLAGIIDDDDDDDENDGVEDEDKDESATSANPSSLKERKSTESNESVEKKDDGPGTPSGSSLWSSFGRLFNFGRSPENGLEKSDGEEEATKRIPPFNSSVFVATSPTTPGNIANSTEAFMTSNTGEQFCHHSSASEEDAGNQLQFNIGGRSGVPRARRVLRAARTLKQPPSSPSTPDGGVDDLTALLADTDIGRSETITTSTTTTNACSHTPTQTNSNGANSTRRSKTKKKVKRRPRVRLVEEDSENR